MKMNLFFLAESITVKISEAAVTIAKESGFSNIGIDLIYGIPGQSLDSWKASLKEAVSLSPQHISTYELTVEEGTDLYTMMKSNTVTGNLSVVPLNEDTVIEMYEYTVDYLTSHGYLHYEISNFARPDYSCRHNLNYWNRGVYYGAGPWSTFSCK